GRGLDPFARDWVLRVAADRIVAGACSEAQDRVVELVGGRVRARRRLEIELAVVGVVAPPSIPQAIGLAGSHAHSVREDLVVETADDLVWTHDLLMHFADYVIIGHHQVGADQEAGAARLPIGDLDAAHAALDLGNLRAPGQDI